MTVVGRAAAAPVTTLDVGPNSMLKALHHVRQPDSRAKWMAVLQRLIALPTVAGSPAVEDAAGLLRRELLAIGMRRCRILRARSGAPPSVWAEWLGAPGRPCLLLYGHFDVQPPGVRAWRHPPFQPVIRDGRLYGRGASDNKGPLVCLLAGLDGYLATTGRLPVNVRVWLEGEEERGSPHLRSFLDRYGGLLRADALAFSDSTRIGGTDRPTVITGLRGMVDVAVTVAGPAHELHSGGFGGEVHDPAMVLAHLVSSLWDVDGRVRVPGFYRDVSRPTAAERRTQCARGARRRVLADTAGVPIRDLRGERGWSPGERSTLRPSLTVVGMSSGRTGRDAVAAIPSSATARINVRLVPRQDPGTVARQLRDHLIRTAPPGTRLRIELIGRAEPVIADPRHRVVGALARALKATWGQPPVPKRSGGTIPIVAELHRRYGMAAALWGLSGPGDRIHAADESIALRDLHRGTDVVVRLLQEAVR
jgi:acetylornithine deacetylase/succinyl-diaminopimelate desuccinylase-like protein